MNEYNKVNIKVSLQKIERETALKIVESLYKSVERIKLFFIDFPHEINIFVAENRDEYVKVLGKTRPDWGVTTIKDNIVYLYNPMLWKKRDTGHTIKDLEFSITHQLVHLYFKKQNIFSPVWFEEGLAVFLSGAYENIDKKKDFIRLLNKYGFIDLSRNDSDFKSHKVPALSYLISHKYILYLVDSFGINKLKIFVNELIEGGSFQPSFERIFSLVTQNSWVNFQKQLKESI